ncbi:MAG: tetratricopeptide repeat protein [Pyrinomonadaceae bacterium]|nr:tetratricopeptide repeat protein [Pyrinomonadaceae bacterium]
MKNLVILISAIAFIAGCSDTPPKVSEKPIEKKELSEKEKETVAAHSVDKEAKITKTAPELPKVERPKEKSKWTQSGDPIDTSTFDAAIEKAKAAAKAKPGDADAKKAVGIALYERALALTKARQYAAAIGDFRRSLEYNPDHKDSKKWIDQITVIYKSLNREVPQKGEEPPPLEFKKQKA